MVGDRMTQADKGWWLGLLGVVIFAFTLPMTRMAVGSVEAPQLSGAFVAMGRACVAALLSLILLLLLRASRPRRKDWFALGMTSLGVVIGFPLLTSIALRHAEAIHASVMIGVLPLATAAVGAVLNRQRPSWAFWFWAVLGACLVLGYAVLRSPETGWRLGRADLLLLLATLCAALGYGYGARLSQTMRAEFVICWALLLALPLTLPFSIWHWPSTGAGGGAWLGFAYVSLFSMWIGFFAWYRGLAWGGTVRVSQVQLLQPFISILAAIPLLGETLDGLTLGFCLAVALSVYLGRRSAIRVAP